MEPTLFDGRILIEPIINKKVHGIATHAKKFRYALRIKNIDERISPDFVLNNITLESAQNQNIASTEAKAFFVPRLNANEEKYFDIGEHSSFMHGLVKIGVSISPVDKEKVIACYQKKPFTNAHLFARTNSWMDFFYIKTPQDIMQEKIISRLKWLTIIVLFLIALQLLSKIYIP